MKRTVNLVLPPGVSIVTPPQSPSNNPFRDSTPELALFPNMIQSHDEFRLIEHTHSVTRFSSQISVDLGPAGDACCPNLPVASRSQYHAMFDKTKEILVSRNNSIPSMSEKAVVLDDRFIKLWAPLLDRVPTVQLKYTLRSYCKI
jgi:hypothetical protein